MSYVMELLYGIIPSITQSPEKAHIPSRNGGGYQVKIKFYSASRAGAAVGKKSCARAFVAEISV